ncbi:MAG TPA: hypothetical protein VLU25_09965 [Acidobacteriota bacterium]|nr:hypothetical protein [Acidobacteriota bacterium]
MNWGRILLGGLAAGIAKNLVDWAAHAGILGSTYEQYEVFRVEPANPLYFFLISICIGIAAAILFAKTRNCWSEGVMGGANFGFWVGLVAFFAPFYHTLTINGFPYFLCWYWGIIFLIGGVIGGAVLGVFIKR